MRRTGLAVDVVTEWPHDPTATIDYQTRFTAMVPVDQPTEHFDPARPFESPYPGAVLNVTAKIGAINEETHVVRVDLSVTNPSDDDARVLTRAQVQVQL